MISQLSVTKHGQAGYSPYADVDRNGVINGGDRQRAQANLGATAPVPAEENPLEVSLPTNALQLAGGSSKTFNTRNGLRWSLTGAEFDLTPADVVVLVNGSQVPAGQIVITDHLLTANVTLADGRNEVSMKAYDTVGRPLHYNEVLWAGILRELQAACEADRVQAAQPAADKSWSFFHRRDAEF